MRRDATGTRTRAVALGGVAVAALAVGLVCGATHVSRPERTARAYAAAWARGDLTAMYSKLAPSARRRFTAAEFRAAHRSAAATATERSLQVGRARDGPGDTFRIAMRVRTHAFGEVDGHVDLPVGDDGVQWRPSMVFPGLRPGERLTRRTRMPERAELLARDGTPLSQLPDIAGQLVGEIGPIPADDAARLRALGYPDDAQVGISGLERFLQERIGGRPGGDLLAGGRVLAHGEPQRAGPVRTTISPDVERAAIAALAGRLGGAVAVNPRNGEVLAFAGIAFSGLQPPGSTFKMVTLTGALMAGIATPRSTYPYATSATLSGVELANANDESCGGTLVQAFATSCNSVFAPLGAKLGARRLVATAERYGFNQPAEFAGAATPAIPPASEIGDDLAVGASAIGQGRVQATALEMVRVAATIARHGHLARFTLARGDHVARGRRVVPAKVARTVGRMMLEVVRNGTGVRAAIPGVKVAGKTGTAELETTTKCEPPAAPPAGALPPTNPEACADSASRTDDTDAWFAAYAPAARPRIAVCVMLVRNGAGGDTAAPAARTILLAGLQR